MRRTVKKNQKLTHGRSVAILLTLSSWEADVEPLGFPQRKMPHNESCGANEKEDGKWEQFYSSLC